MESKWFVDENVKNIDKEILLCFPYAGASINMFSMWKEYIDKEILGNEEMMNFFIPLLRADFEMDEKYLRKNKVKLECSINAFCGENDTEATETDMQEWGEYTSDFALEVFAGDHFFIKSNAKTVQSLNEIIKRNI